MATIRKRGDKWQARVQRRSIPAQSKSFNTRADAEKWSRAVEREIDLGIYVVRSAAERSTVGDIIKRYFEEVTPTKRGCVLEEIRLNALRRRSISKISLAALSAKHMAAYRDERLKTVSPVTVNRDLDDLSAILNHARREWGIPVSNVVSEIRRPSRGRGRDRVLDEHEENRLLESLEGGRDAQGRFSKGTRNPWVKPIVQLALETAMRRGELLALEWQHVDLKKRLAHLLITKNGESRTVPLSLKAVAILANIPRAISGRIFPITPMALRKAFERACETAGISDLHFHDLRHTATTRLSEKLPNLIELAAVTGHKDVRMLARYYHPKAEYLAKKLG
jgi:integrase